MNPIKAGLAMAMTAGLGYAGTLYVAPTGSDAWSGRLEQANATRNDGPVQSLAAARDRARQLRAASPNEAVQILLRGGIYYLPETLRLSPEDSGVTWQAYPNETATISGGRPITGWQETTVQDQRAWQVRLTEVAQGTWSFRQLFVQHQGESYFTRRFRPHKGMLVVAGLTYSPQRKAMPHRAAQQDFIYAPGDLEVWDNLDDVELVALHSWSASRLRIQSIDPEKDVVTFTSVPTFRIGSWYKSEQNPYYVENLKTELKSPGQWYLDRPSGLLTYLPLPGETPQNTTVVAPVLDKLVLLAGDPAKGRFVEHVRFAGLRFGHNEWAVPSEGYDTSQGQPQLPAAIELAGAKDCGLERCVVANTGAYGVGLGLGTAACYVRGCFLYDLGGGGVKVGDSRMPQNAEPPLLPVGNLVENNTITDLGVVHYSANGVWAGIVRDTRIRHNEVSHGPYTGIAVGWNWSPTPTSAGGNVIEGNLIHDVMQLVQDGGGIYTLGRQPGNIVRGNVIHDNHRGRFACADGQIGLYFDEGSSGFLVEDNVVYDVDWNHCQIAQNRNTAGDHDIRTNYLGIRPGEPGFPQAIADRAGVEKEWQGGVFPVTFTPNPVSAMQWPEMLKVPTSFRLDFEDIPLGRMPRRWSSAGFTGKAWFGVTDELAASGTRCLKAQDAADLPKSFYPYVSYKAETSQGPVVFSCDLRQGNPPSQGTIEFRNYRDQEPGKFAVGPSLHFAPDGKLRAGGKELLTLPLDQWVHVAVTFSFGPNAKPEYTLAVTVPGKAEQTFTLPFASQQFTVLTDLYLISDAVTDTAFYLDNLALSIEE